MIRINIAGGTGYAGRNIARQARADGHVVTVFSRSRPADAIEGVTYSTGSVLESEFLASVPVDADVVVSALSPRGELAGKTRGVLRQLAELTGTAGVRFGVVGGAGSLKVSPTGPLLLDTDGFPDAFKAEAQEMRAVLEDLQHSPADLDWFYVSPAAEFGAHSPGGATGHYRTGTDVLVLDKDGRSRISGEDFGRAVVDEMARPQHRRQRFTVAQ